MSRGTASTPTGKRRGTRDGTLLRRGLIALSVLVVIAAIAVTTVLGVRYAGAQAEEDARSSALDAADRYVKLMFGYTPQDVEENIKKTMAVVTGEAKKTYQERIVEKNIATEVKQQGIVSQIEIQSSGVVENTRDSAKVLLFINQSASAAKSDDVAANPSRILYTMHKQGGEWKISDIEIIDDTVLKDLVESGDVDLGDAVPIPNPTTSTPAPEPTGPQQSPAVTPEATPTTEAPVPTG
ncbi:hypothetical protein [Gordonia sp. VNK21]|uniref:hypothetical protein n=1 Tax=Gordonia sp. VNK21 TaxID=3382483 RepID=UPI0038D398AF